MERLQETNMDEENMIDHNEVSLYMECVDEELEPCQKAAIECSKRELDAIRAQIDQHRKNSELLIEGTETTCFVKSSATITTSITPAIQKPLIHVKPPSAVSNMTPVARSMVPLPQGSAGPIVVQGKQGSTGLQTGSYLVMDQNIGLIVGAMPPTSTSGTQVLTNSPFTTTSQSVMQSTSVTTSHGRQLTTAASTPGPSTSAVSTAVQSGKIKVIQPNKSALVMMVSQPPGSGTASAPSASSSVTTVNNSKVPEPKRIQIQKEIPTVDLTKSEEGTVEGDPKVITTISADSNQGKTFPSLVVVVRPRLLDKIGKNVAVAERAKLDANIKTVIVYTATRFTEWLIQRGLVRSEQQCTLHVTPQLAPIKFKLGMYSDGSRFPYSGGYVWISDCCPSRLVSVFNGSIFEGAPHPPTVLLKLMYHWACQTSVPNVIQWVKVDNYYVKNFYSYMRSICVSANSQKFGKLGKANKCIEVGVISLGTTSQDGSQRQVKVEVLGAMDYENKWIRLRAVDPQEVDRNSKKRFFRILSPLVEWVDSSCIIVTDFTLDKEVLHQLGFKNVIQTSPGQSNDAKYTNNHVMDYLRQVVPRMFQNTLSLLSRSLIQQFLDELVWRERWGTMASAAFDNIVDHLADLTKAKTGESLITRLNKIASNPFANWSYEIPGKETVKFIISNGNVVKATASGNQLVQVGPQQISAIDMLPESIRDVQMESTVNYHNTLKRSGGRDSGLPTKVPRPEEMRPMESYYYGFLNEGSETNLKPLKLTFKCPVCLKSLSNNLEVIKHAMLHVDFLPNVGGFPSNALQCKYCMKDIPRTYNALQFHVEGAHIHSGSNNLCRICEEPFRRTVSLINHMHSSHLEKEMPYVCGACGFRASFHYVILDHFWEAHVGMDVTLCPFCLKILSLKSGVAFTNIMQHMQKHRTQPKKWKCPYCTLEFLNEFQWRDHHTQGHMSFRDHPKVENLQVPGSHYSPILMPPPPVTVIRTAVPNKVFPSARSRLMYSSIDIGDIVLYDVEKDCEKCIECKEFLTNQGHYPGYLCCEKCRYATCCKKAMHSHLESFHANKYNIGNIVSLPKEMHCVCGFHTNSGNKLANHLAKCIRKSAYPSVLAARKATVEYQSASFPPLIDLDDQEEGEKDPSEEWLKAYVKKDNNGARSKKDAQQQPKDGELPSMLNVLGLVRKSSTDEPTDLGGESEKEENDGEEPQSSGNKDEAKKSVDETPADDSEQSKNESKDTPQMEIENIPAKDDKSEVLKVTEQESVI